MNMIGPTAIPYLNIQTILPGSYNDSAFPTYRQFLHDPLAKAGHGWSQVRPTAVTGQSWEGVFLEGPRGSSMVSRCSRLLHAFLAVACSAGIVYFPAQAQTALSLQLGQPGYYGPINFGHLAPPPVVDPRPLIVRPARGQDRWPSISIKPVYLRVPPIQARDWGRYCGLYQACRVPVLFVRDDWYRKVYAPQLRAAAAWEAHRRRERD